MAALCILTPLSIQAQVLLHLPAIDDSEPQRIYRLIDLGGRLYVDSATEIGVPDARFRALTNYYVMGGWSAARSSIGAISSIYGCDPWVSVFTPLSWGPLPYQIEGLAWISESERLIACAWDEALNVSIVLGIDAATGASKPLASFPPGLRFSGLAASYLGLAGVTRDLQTDASAVYLIDMSTWGVAHLVDLPAPCEALGALGDYPGWFAAGERVFRVTGTEVVEWPVETSGSEIGTIVALGDWFGFSAVEPTTWGRVKRHYR
jgi:hypothetical protein